MKFTYRIRKLSPTRQKLIYSHKNHMTTVYMTDWIQGKWQYG